MPLRRLHRRLVAWLVAACVLFAQTAAIAYACQRQQAPASEASVPCTAHLAEPDDADALFANANVCEVHCHPVSLPDVAGPDLPPSAAIAAWWVPPQPLARATAAPVAELEAKSAAPPPRTLYARLLI